MVAWRRRFRPVRGCHAFLSLALLAVLLAGPRALAQEAALPSVTVTPVQKIKIAESVERVGQTSAVEDVDLRARVQGFLEERAFEEGGDVKRGDLLFVIERDPYEAEVQRAAAALARARAVLTKTGLDLERAQELRKRDNVSQQRVDDAVAADREAAADVQAREAELRIAELNLSYTEIKAPVDGRIGRSAYSIGDLVGPDSGVLATLATLDPIYVYWGVGEQVLLGVHMLLRDLEQRGEAAPVVVPRIRFQDGSVYRFDGLIDFLDNRVDPSTGTQTIRAVFPNPEKILIPGQFVTIVVQIGEAEDRLVIPQAAVQEDQAGRFVLVVDDQDQVIVRRVELGRRDGIYWIVESGLAEGEEVVWQGVQKVRPGLKVRKTLATPEQPVSR